MTRWVCPKGHITDFASNVRQVVPRCDRTEWYPGYQGYAGGLISCHERIRPMTDADDAALLLGGLEALKRGE